MVEPTFTLALCGGGNLAHATIATVGHQNPNSQIRLLSRRPEVWRPEIKAYTQKSSWEHKGVMTGQISKCSNKASEIVPGANIILICSPAHTKIPILQEIRDHIDEGAFVGSIFG